MKEKTLEDFYNLLQMNNINLVYCPNEVLGTSGPIVDVDLNTLKDMIINHRNPFEEPKQELLTEETMTSGVR